MSVGRFLVTRPHWDSGLGSNLASLAGAVWLARRLNRTLVVDWRGMDVLRDRSLNYFTQVFEAVPSIAGVPVVYAGSADAPEHDGEFVGIGEAERSAAPIVALQNYHGLERVDRGTDAVTRHTFLKEAYAAVRPVGGLGARIDDWWRQHLEDSFVVGVNLRTGNGHWFHQGAPYAGRIDASIFRNRRRLLRNVRRACDSRMRGLPREFRSCYRIFFATDSVASHELLSSLPRAVTRRTVFPPPGTGDHFSEFERVGYSDVASVEDTVADMFLLSRCHALVYNFSMFNQLPRVVTDYYGGNLLNIERLYGRTYARAAWRRLRR